VVAITDIAGGGNNGFYFVVVSVVLDVGVWVFRNYVANSPDNERPGD